MRTWTRVGAVALVLAGGLTGCGDGIGGEAEGQVAGHSLDVQDAIFTTLPLGIGVSAQYIALSDVDDLCAALQATTSTNRPRSATVLDFALFNVDAAGDFGLADTGTYSILGPMDEDLTGRVAAGALWKTGAQGEELIGEEGLSTDGAVELSSVESGEDGVAEGRFDVKFGVSALKGKFQARACALPASYFNQGRTPARERL